MINSPKIFKFWFELEGFGLASGLGWAQFEFWYDWPDPKVLGFDHKTKKITHLHIWHSHSHRNCSKYELIPVHELPQARTHHSARTTPSMNSLSCTKHERDQPTSRTTANQPQQNWQPAIIADALWIGLKKKR